MEKTDHEVFNIDYEKEAGFDIPFRFNHYFYIIDCFEEDVKQNFHVRSL